MGTRIKEARQARGWSQQDLAERVGVSQPTIVHWEQGTHTPRNLALARLADTLGVSRQWLQEPPDAPIQSIQMPAQSGHRSTRPIFTYLNAPIHHVPVFSGPLDRDEVEACLRAQRPAIAYIPVAIPVITPIGLLIDDPAIATTFPAQTIGIIECADRNLVVGKTYLLSLNGVARLRVYQTGPTRFEADAPSDTTLVRDPPVVLGRLLVAIRQF